MKRNIKEQTIKDSRLWWEDLTEDEQIEMIMKYGFEKINPKNISSDQILEIWGSENPGL